MGFSRQEYWWDANPFCNMSDYRWPTRRKNFETTPFKCTVKMSSSTVKYSFSSSDDKYSISHIKPQGKAKGPSPIPLWGRTQQCGVVCLSVCTGVGRTFPTRAHTPASRNLNYVLAREVHGQRVGRRDDEAHGGHEHVHAARAGHVPLAPLIVVLQDTFIPFVDNFLQGKRRRVLA